MIICVYDYILCTYNGYGHAMDKHVILQHVNEQMNFSGYSCLYRSELKCIRNRPTMHNTNGMQRERSRILRICHPTYCDYCLVNLFAFLFKQNIYSLCVFIITTNTESCIRSNRHSPTPAHKVVWHATVANIVPNSIKTFFIKLNTKNCPTVNGGSSLRCVICR